jgi:hypothetical protein
MTCVSATSRNDCRTCGPGVLFVGLTCLHCKRPSGGRKPRGQQAEVFKSKAAKLRRCIALCWPNVREQPRQRGVRGPGMQCMERGEQGAVEIMPIITVVL